MKTKIVSLSILFAAALATQPAVQAADTTLAIEQMADIMLNIDAKPSGDAVQTLDDIAKDSASTSNERMLASTIKNMDKKIRPDDKPTVMKIWLSPSASENERSMAKILLRFDEKPSDTAKETLSEWVEQ
jgi:hypothetical protein